MGPPLDPFFELTPSFLCVVDPEGRWEAINPAFCAALGRSEAELLGRPVAEMLHATDLPGVEQAWASVRGGGVSVELEQRYRRADGLYFSSAWRLTGLEGRVYTVGLDLTQSRRGERMTAEAQAIAKVGGFDQDLESKERYWSPALFEILELPFGPAPPIDQLYRMVRADHREKLVAAAGLARLRGEPFQMDVAVESGAGTLKWLRVALRADSRDGKVVRIFGAIQDITLTRQSEEALRESEARYRALYKRTPAMLHSIDRQGRLVSVSDHWLETMGYKYQEVIGRASTDFLTPESRRYAREVILPSFMATGSCHDVAYQMVKKSGEIIDVKLSATSERNELGEVTQSLAVVSDVTAQKKADDAVHSSLREKEVLLKEVHHRVKNNLQIITSLLNLQAGQLTDSPARDTLLDAQNRVRAMATIHERLYLSPDLTRIDFGGYLGDLLTELRRALARPEIEVRLEASGALLSVETAIPCGLIVNELVANAIKHAFPDGRSGQVWVILRHDEQALELTVADDGVGISAERRSGSIGLKLVDRLVRQLGGALELQTQGGTRATVRCPSEKGALP